MRFSILLGEDFVLPNLFYSVRQDGEERGLRVEGPKVAEPDPGGVRRDEEPRLQSRRWQTLRAVSHSE